MRYTRRKPSWLWLPVAVYSLLAALLILQNPGLQYDEALLVLGGVQMLRSPAELPLPHDPDTWLCAGRCFPLMTVRYAGAVKEYLAVPVFAALGTTADAVRVVSVLLGALGIAGLAGLLRTISGQRAALAAGFLLAVNPAYVTMTVFDNGTVAAWMAALGLLCLALSRYVARPHAWTAFLLGLSAGFGIWARANFLWVLAAMALAALLVLRGRLFARWRHLPAAAAGAILGGLPFLVYQVVSRGGTWQAIGMFRASEPLRQRMWHRFVLFCETMLCDREHRAMWDGPPMPDWQRWLFPALMLIACLLCLHGRAAAAARITALTFFGLAAFLFTSRLMVAEHHLVVLLPLGCAAVALACAGLETTIARAAAALAALAYLGSAGWWITATSQGIAATGGIGPWSNSISTLATHIDLRYPTREVRILDWGLQNNLFALSGGRLRSREIFDGATERDSPAARPWMDEVRDGGLFLVNGPKNRYFPQATAGFLAALAASQAQYRRAVIRTRPSDPQSEAFAELYDVAPNSGTYPKPPPPPADSLLSRFPLGDRRASAQLEGFHNVEEERWRWTRRRFSITFPSPGPGPAGIRFHMRVFLPPTAARQLLPLTMEVRAGGIALAPETFRSEGYFDVVRELTSSQTSAGLARFDFALDKAIAPNAADGRELGLIVLEAGLEAR